MYDFLIVGAGLFGSVFAHEATRHGKTCLVIDSRNHIGGNCFTEDNEGITVHKYGPHIFHTKNKDVWNYMNQFADFNRFTNSPLAVFRNKVFNLPFNMNTFYQLWGVKTPREAKAIIDSQRVVCYYPKNLQEKALDMVGKDIYEIFIKEYTEKQWGRSCEELDPDIISRIPLRFTFDNNYFNDPFQGVPIGGYTPIFQKLLHGSTVCLNENFSISDMKYKNAAKTIIYTGMADKLFDYKFGRLPYRSLRFETKVCFSENVQGNAVVNYTGKEKQFTRVIEHKHFLGEVSPISVLTAEYPSEFVDGAIPYYPISNPESDKLYQRYKKEAEANGIILGGRIGTYSYDDMDVVVRKALSLVRSFFETEMEINNEREKN